MGSQNRIGNLFRVQLKLERTRRGWSQLQLANAVASRHKMAMYSTTIAKLEAGDRGVTVDELFAFAEIFGTSVDALIGHRPGGTDVMWAASKLSSNAHRFVGEVISLQERLSGDVGDLAYYADRDQHREAVQPLIDAGNRSYAALFAASDALSRLAGEFPMPGMGSR